MKTQSNKMTKGFTLTELIITIAVLGIIAAVAIPSYDSYKRKGYRMDAISYLTAAAAFEEEWMSENSSYTSNKANIGGDDTQEDHYTITVTADATSFTITATPKGAQTSDKDCAEYSIDHIGRKLAEKDDASDNSTKCWGR